MRFSLVAMLLVASGVLGQEPKPQAATPEQQFGLLRAVKDSIVTVEYTLRYDNGEPPRGLGFEQSGPGGPYYAEAGEGLVKQERPLEVFSYLVGEELVLSEELLVHERFIEKIEVKFKDQTVAAMPVAWARSRNAVYLKLAQPLKGAKPLVFNGDLPGPYTGLVAAADHGVPSISITPFAPNAVITSELGEYFTTPREALLVDKSGAAVGMSMSEHLPAGQSWKGDPRKWEQITAEQREQLLDKTRAVADRGVVRVTINFRSPKSQPNPFAGRGRFRGGEEEEDITEQHLVGVLLDDGRVIVPASLKPEVTARLERIRIYPAQGEPVEAKFVGSLRDYGAFIAGVANPSGGLKLSELPITRSFGGLLPHANVEVRGEERLIFLGHRRIASFNRGWRKNLYPTIADDAGDTFLFDESGALIAMPLTQRQRFAGDENQYQRDQALLTPASYLHEALAHLDANLDPANVPLSEQEESRLAWLGVVLQPLDPDLAQANKVSELTQNGQTGALVNFVYPGSPAAEAGVEPGWVLLRLHIPGHPQPINITVDERSAGFALPWDRFDEMPEQVFDRIPAPWPDASNGLTKALTEAGFGTAVKVEFASDGNRLTKEFKVQQSPAHYDSAARHKSETLGLTVRDITYEVRQYFQLEGADPGVVISRIEPGSKASVAGIKPYEMVTHVNGLPVKSVQEFAEAIKPGGELRFTVKRMTRTRQVPVKVDVAAPAETKPATEK